MVSRRCYIKEFIIYFSSNAWEYAQTIKIKAYDLVRIDEKKIRADSVEIEFDEEFCLPDENLNLKATNRVELK